MSFALLVVAVILFAIDFLWGFVPNPPWSGRFLALGLAFFAASFAVH